MIIVITFLSTFFTCLPSLLYCLLFFCMTQHTTTNIKRLDQRMSASMYEVFHWDGAKDSPRPKQMQLSLAGSSINIDDPIGELSKQITLELLNLCTFLLNIQYCIKERAFVLCTFDCLFSFLFFLVMVKFVSLQNLQKFLLSVVKRYYQITCCFIMHFCFSH